jgi:hypothetical protein
MRFRPANIRLINRRPDLPRLLLALSSEKGKTNDNDNDNDKNNPTDSQGLTGHSISDVPRAGDLAHSLPLRLPK